MEIQIQVRSRLLQFRVSFVGKKWSLNCSFSERRHVSACLIAFLWFKTILALLALIKNKVKIYRHHVGDGHSLWVLSCIVTLILAELN